jgi:cellulose 1,4-beta-cellobiosidase
MRSVRLNASVRGLMVAVLALGSALLAAPATQIQAAAGCAVTYKLTNQWTSTPTSGGMQIDLSITNNATTAINGWTLTFAFPNGQTLLQLWNAAFTQTGANVTMSSNQSWNATIAPGGTLSGVGFTGGWSGTNGIPSSFSVNGVACGGVGTTTATPTPVLAVTSTPTLAVATNTPTRTPTPVTGTTSTSTTTPTATRTSTPVVGATSTATRTSTPVVGATSTATPTPPAPTSTPTSTATPVGPTSTPTATPLAGAHLDNPFPGATGFVNPLWKANVDTAAQAAQSSGDANLAAQMRAIENVSTAVWMDRIAAVNGTDGGLGLSGYLDAALTQKRGSTPEAVIIVVYDLPGRDCNALASNGELPATAAGLTTYQTQYTSPLVQIMGQSKYSGLRIVAIVEPDSLPNITTNSNVQTCASATPFYEAGVAYALDHLHAISNVYTYVDAAHAGWLGWPNNSSGAVNEFVKVANMTVAKFASIDGFITDTANTTPLKEPFFQGSTNIGGTPVMNSSFYEFNPSVDEAAYTADRWAQLTQSGRFPTTLGIIVDTSRNGWSGALRPTAASTSTAVETFVSQSKVDHRPHRGAWCNQNGAGIGERPVAVPAGFPSSHLDAFVWVKPPGESDGSSTAIANNEGKGFDRMCDPTFNAPALKGALTNALPNAPLAGHWFPTQFVQLVQNAFPAIQP